MNGFALNNIQNAYVGSTPAQAIYLGSTLIWPTTPPTPTPAGETDYFTIELHNNDSSDHSARFMFIESWDDWSSSIGRQTMEYSLDNGTTWNTYTLGLYSTYTDHIVNSTWITSYFSSGLVNANSSKKILLRANFDKMSYIQFSSSLYSFDMPNFYCEFSGNIKSLLYGDNYYNTHVTLPEKCFSNTFAGWHSYRIFTTINNSTTTNTVYTYNKELVNTNNLYLPDEISNECYAYMFYNCSSLVTAPELRATILTESCYNHMFFACSSLNYIKCLATDISATDATYSWVNSVAATGTFVKDATMSSWTTGNDGIPSGWNVIDA